MKLEKMMIVRTIVMILALVNQLLVMSGLSPIPYDNDQIEYVVTGVITVGSTLWVWWKNNDVTRKARENKNK